MCRGRSSEEEELGPVVVVVVRGYRGGFVFDAGGSSRGEVGVEERWRRERVRLRLRRDFISSEGIVIWTSFSYESGDVDHYKAI